MAKKKVTRKKAKPPTEMIHFRPGAQLGALIGKFADELAISRGEVAKRFTALTIRGFDIGFYRYADELSEYLYSSFDDAVGHLHVALVSEIGDDTSVFEVPREERIQILERWIATYRSVRELEDSAEQKQVEIRIFLTD